MRSRRFYLYRAFGYFLCIMAFLVGVALLGLGIWFLTHVLGLGWTLAICLVTVAAATALICAAGD